MKTLKFKCRLCSDIIINVKSATEGNNNTLDFIPGNNFLGIVASQLYGEVTSEEALDLFHNGVVRYGDAHLAVGDKRSLKVPAAMYYPKLKSPSEELYIFYAYDRDKDNEKLQLKQCRNGYYAFDEEKGIMADVRKSFAIKSAYDKFSRRSKDEQMFGYESLRKGLVFYFSVDTDKDEYAEKIEKALVGKKHIGRSRTAQYGQVDISLYDFEEEPLSRSSKEEITVYADGRLIFLDKYGEPTFRPTADQLGIIGGSINWEKSQIRTFQYAPWNSQRQAYDTDRCGIEKGSVFVVSGGEITGNGCVGSYRNEGFGKVIYNPRFLAVVESSNGVAKYKLQEKEDDDNKKEPISSVQTQLISFVKKEAEKQRLTNQIYEEVNKFVGENQRRFIGDNFASQWGTIRSIAMSASSKKEIKIQLFDKMKGNEPFAYLTHGVAKEKWEKNRRKDVFEKFFNDVYSQYDSINVKQALVNLASQMAKLYRGKEGKR